MAEIGESSYRRFPGMDTNALDAILLRYGDALVRYAYSMVQDASAAEDIVADSIAALLLRRRPLQDADHLRAYLYKVVRNKAVDHLRRRRHLVPLEDVEQVLGGGDPETDYLIDQRNRTIYQCMQCLPLQYRQVLQLAYFDAFAPQQIARILGKTVKQVYNLLARAKVSLRELLEKEGISHEDL